MERIRKPYVTYLLLIAGTMITTVLLVPEVSKSNSKQGVVAEAIAPTVAFSIVGNARIVSGPWHSRAMTVFVQPEDFTVERVQSVFVRLSHEYPTENDLSIRALSDSSELKEVAHRFSVINSYPFGVVPFDRLPSGGCPIVNEPERLSAIYYRGYTGEYFDYYPASGPGLRVELKEASGECTASGDEAFDLVIASRLGFECEETVKKLLDGGADPNMKDRFDSVALVEAALAGHLRIVKLLLERGADINGRSPSGWTPLIAAISLNRLSVIELLLSRGADVNVMTEDGRTALLAAVQRSNVGIVKGLLGRGVDVKVKDGYGRTALAIARKQHNHLLIGLLKRAGAISR